MTRRVNLGIWLVDKDVVEAADAYGMTWQRKLLEVEIPLAMPGLVVQAFRS